jgi:hypothetical protein
VEAGVVDCDGGDASNLGAVSRGHHLVEVQKVLVSVVDFINEKN